MRGLIFLGFGLVALGFGSAALPHETVNYRLTPEMRDGAVVALAVDMRFRGNPSGKTVLDLPDEWAGQAGRWKYLSDLNVKGAKVQIPKPSQRILLAPPRAKIRLSYRISSAYPDDPPASGGNPYDGAIIRPTWFASLGNFVFIAIHGRADDWAKFAWGPLPKGWQVVSDLEPSPGAHMIADEISNSVLMGGQDLKVTVRPVEGGAFRLAMRGKWLFSEDQVTDMAATIVSAQRRFWGRSVGPYLVTVTPLFEKEFTHTSMGGTGRYQAFAIYGTLNTKLADLLEVLAHEHTHNWIPNEVGRLPEDKTEPSAYWLSEGFTDFYADRSLLRANQLSMGEFLRHLNGILKKYAASSVRSAPNARIVADFWTNPEVQRLPYQRGYLQAFVWDAKISETTNGRRSLDDVMFEMRRRFTAAPRNKKPDLVSNFVRSTRHFGIDLRGDIQTIMEAGGEISLSNLFAPCAEVNTLSLPIFDPGFDPTADPDHFAKVDPEGPAYRAGIREGMVRVKWLSGAPDDPSVPMSYLVKDNDGPERTVSYLPIGKSSLQAQQVALTDFGQQHAEACRQFLSGDKAVHLLR